MTLRCQSALTVENGIGDGHKISLEGAEAQALEGQSEVLAGRCHGNLERETEDIQRPVESRLVDGHPSPKFEL
jgi:hypothetical protein